MLWYNDLHSVKAIPEGQRETVPGTNTRLMRLVRSGDDSLA